MSRRVLVTGATGFAGRHLVAACEAAGDDGRPRAAVVGRPTCATRPSRARSSPTRGPTSSTTSPRAPTSGESWEDPLGTLADNVAIDRRTCSRRCALEAPEAVVVAVGSGEEYGPPETVPTTEDAPLRPQNPYAVSKASAGLLARFYADAHGLRVIHARAFNHAGPGQEPIYAIANFARQFAAGLAPARTRSAIVTGSPDTRRDFTDVRDVVRAYRLLAAHGEPGIYNVCSGVSRSARELIAALGEVAGVAVDHRGRPGQGPRARGDGDPRLQRRACAPPRAGSPEIPLEQTLADTLATVGV